MKYNVVIVEDEQGAYDALKKQIDEYQKRNKNVEFDVTHYLNATEFLDKPFDGFDLIFLDIEMPGISGIEAARKIRKTNEDVMIVFVTNMAQYALESYDVHAYDFILKPVNYDSFSIKFERCVNALSHKLLKREIVLAYGTNKKKVDIGDITFIESSNHNVIVHFKGGEFRMRTTLASFEKQLKGCHFVYCNACYLVNLKWVKELKGDSVVVDNSELRISHLKKPMFLSEFAKYIGGTV